jgi:hypothetical protein
LADDEPPSFTYHLASHLTYSPTQVMTVALIKRTPILDPTAPLATQVHVLNLFGGDETPYESLHALVSSGVKPWFEAFAGSRGSGKDVDSKMGMYSGANEGLRVENLAGIPATKKKFAELELQLLHLQQNVEIPETHLVIHPTIMKAVTQVSLDPTFQKVYLHILGARTRTTTQHHGLACQTAE